MAISFDNALGIHPSALGVRVQRAEIIANNLANADTPGFKSRDIDFRAILNAESDKLSSVKLDKTDDQHIDGLLSPDEGLKFRNPHQPAIDGNTVETQVEHTEYMQNAMRYQATFQFLNSKFKGLSGAIKGE
ncbi:flagellar basal body rod protein FlgB [Litoribrevibacter albus]|uniref:Flagellar basal body rod protein FlgB n=1 Tax=Litoribrevibacter albus TaxID=1473156 RepID=A0AA37SCZ7_9GAMM|nr:flagellar basal body rod protein FlgB [Litoribrevibacter albus]GLQ32211.1 flagellar basal body rod protein FlgB [Litoribrevibacter albus]